MRRLRRSCLLRSSVVTSEMSDRLGAIHSQTLPVGVQAMAGGFLTPDYDAKQPMSVLVRTWTVFQLHGSYSNSHHKFFPLFHYSLVQPPEERGHVSQDICFV